MPMHWQSEIGAMFAVLVIALPVVVAGHGAFSHARSVSLSTPHAPGFLQKDDSCECSHRGTCSCQGALEFMTCIKNSCESDECRCVVSDRKHFKEACQHMAAGCPDLGLMCADEEATCDGETIGWIPTDDFVRFHDNGKQSQELIPDLFQGNLPAGWEKVWSREEGRYYYVKSETGESSWTPPPTSGSEEKTSADTEDNAGYSNEPGEEAMNMGGETYVTLRWHKGTVEDLKKREHHGYARQTLADIVGLCIIMALMTSSNATTAKNTWFIVNFTICVFVALLWYYVTLAFFTQFHVQKWMRVGVHTFIGILLLLLSSVLTWAIQRKCGNKDAATFNAIYDHVLVWCFCGIASDAQSLFTHSATQVFLVLCALVFFFAALAYFWHTVVAKFTTRFGSDHSIDFLTGTALSSGVVHWVHLVLTGAWVEVGFHDPKKKSITTKILMALCSLAWIVVALKAAPLVKRLSDQCMINGEAKPNMYWKLRALDTLGIFSNWLSHFSVVLSLGNLIISHFGFNPSSADGHLYITVASCFIGVALIALCTKVQLLRESTSLSTVLVSLSGFMVGTSLAGGMNNSIHMALEGNGKVFEWRLLIASCLTAIVCPVYFFCFKPLYDQRLGVTSRGHQSNSPVVVSRGQQSWSPIVK